MSGKQQSGSERGTIGALPVAESLEAPILVVEDDPLSAMLLSAVVKKGLGLQVDWVPGTALAVQLIRRAAASQGGDLPRAILCDMNLSDEVSDGLLTWVRTSAVTESMPVLAISADDGRAMRQRALDAGATSFLGKVRVVTELIPWLKQHMLSEEAAAGLRGGLGSESGGFGSGAA